MVIKNSLQSQAYDTLKEQILSNILTPGVLYSETKISKELGISRTPMREALQLVLKRHPEWKQEEKQKGGFKVGAAPADKDDTANKVLPKGKVIF